MVKQLLVFDMDGVLVDVSESYRETIVRTVEHFTGYQITRGRIQDYKNSGGWNNDWALSQKICADLGVEVDYPTVVAYFNELFLNQGLIHRERWLPRNGFFETLLKRFDLAIFTGRNQREAGVTLQRECCGDHFCMIVSSDDVENGKPHPEGLLKIAARHPGKRLLYVGDTVDDARSASAANVPFIGVVGLETPGRDAVVNLLQQEGAIQVLSDINEIC
ncbi:MAG TPA: HAD-IA family hydrolase [Bryobacteraceae bacterium]|nr:HAD-IA family hydrolase [Bryobacteraceae bacterium]